MTDKWRWRWYWKPGEQKQYTDCLRGLLGLPPIPAEKPGK